VSILELADQGAVVLGPAVHRLPAGKQPNHAVRGITLSRAVARTLVDRQVVEAVLDSPALLELVLELEVGLE